MKQRKVADLPHITATIHAQSHDGRGIALAEDGKTTFVSGAIINETVTFKLTKKHARYNEADAVEIITPSPDRASPGCQHFGVCGGCSMQHMSPTAQILLKQKTLLEQLKHFGQITPAEVLEPISHSQWGYRRKARLGVRYVQKKEKLLIGFREKSSRYLADLSTCEVLHPSVGKKLPEIAALIASLVQYEHIAQIEVAVGDNATALVIRHLADLPSDDIAKIESFAENHAFEIYLQPNSPQKLHKLYPKNTADRLTYTLSDHNIEMHFHPLDFTQVNGEVNPLMIERALSLLDIQNEDEVLDLFCGLGNFTLPLARRAKHVIGVEGSDEMVQRAYENARINKIENAEFFAANLFEIPSNKPEWMQKKYAKILIDPPRTGAKEVVDIIDQFGAKKIVYVSCNPATLARDANILVHTHGYKLKKAGVINMFPHTTHIEAIALFEK